MKRLNHAIVNWLKILSVLVLTMIIVGGFTRLTNSGLSITEWKPVTGILPPLSEYSWQEEFTKYQQSPEFSKINYDISFYEFKKIYLIEFIHRLIARLLGFFLTIPFIYFIYKGQFNKQEILRYIAIIILFASQGAMGWYMVKSGLVDNPHVSHFRLAAHLFLAVILYMSILWQIFVRSRKMALIKTGMSLNHPLRLSVVTIFFVLLQIIIGGLVAGLKAGLIYNEFPFMGGEIIPYEITHNLAHNLAWSAEIFNDPVFIQFTHRMMAYFIFCLVVALCYQLMKLNNRLISQVAKIILFLTILQMILGIITLLYMVPIIPALLHQLCAIILLSYILWAYYLLKINSPK